MTTIKEMQLATSPDTMINIVNSDPGHIARAKAKANRIAKAKVKAKESVDISHKCTVAIALVLGSLIGYIYTMI